MAAKLTRKERAQLQSQQARQASSTLGSARSDKEVRKQKPITRSGNSRLIRNLNLILIALAAVVYVNSLVNEYALDDYSLILENTQTKQGYHAFFKIFGSSYREGYMGNDGALYRPLSKAMFALEYSMTQGPGLNHFMNVVLFTISVVLLFRMLRLYLKGSLLVPFLTSAIFAVHPIHTEVVANIKGRDDILCFLFFVVTAIYVYRYVTTNNMRDLILSGVSMFLCFLSKESAITFIAVIPLMVYFFVGDKKRDTFQPLGITLAGITLLFLGIRYLVLRGTVAPVPVVDNYIAGIDGFLNQRATAVAIAGIYLVKLFVPYQLVCDASLQQIPAYTLASWQFLLPFVIFAGALLFAIMKFRKKHILSFAILYFFITFSIVSNIPFLLGTNYGERLLYAPSLGICLALAFFIGKLVKGDEQSPSTLNEFFNANKRSMMLCGLIAVVFGVLTIMRNPDWSNNRSLYSTDVQKSTNSCKLHYYYANDLTQNDSLDQYKEGSPERMKLVDTALAEFKRAVAIYPAYSDAMQKMAEMFFEKQLYDSADFYYRKAIHQFPSNAIYRNNYGRMLFTIHRVPEAIDQFKAAIRFNPGYATAYNNLAGAVGTQGATFVIRGQQDKYHQQEYFQYAMSYYQQSVNYSLQAIALDPYFIQAYSTVAMTYQNMGDNANAQKYSATAQQLQQSGQGHN